MIALLYELRFRGRHYLYSDFADIFYSEMFCNITARYIHNLSWLYSFMLCWSRIKGKIFGQTFLCILLSIWVNVHLVWKCYYLMLQQMHWSGIVSITYVTACIQIRVNMFINTVVFMVQFIWKIMHESRIWYLQSISSPY